MSNESTPAASNFIKTIIEEDNRSGKYGGRVQTRFPPEPNGYLHIGHAKSICLNFGIAEQFGGKTNLRFDDTNPIKEDTEYVDSIMEDVHWLGYEWDELRYASDYFHQLYDWAVTLIKDGKAYVDDLSAEEMREYRGTLTKPGKNSPFRDRSVEENLDLFARMKKGEFPDGARVLRAKIDMASPNINLRDPVLYRILHAHHHRTGDEWCIYPMYDWAHGQSDSIEHVTHSICTLEFENNRPLYNWLIDELDIYAPQQIEFARLNLSYTIMSKRKLLTLVRDGHVAGWDDPRMPTLSGLRRRGYTPAAVRNFCDSIGVARANSTVDIGMLEAAIRDDLNTNAPRVMAILDPLKVVIENYPQDKVEWFEMDNHPQKPEMGSRKMPFGREIYIERNDFMEDPPRKFFRLAVGREVRLMKAYLVTCTAVIKDEDGNILELRCTYDPETRGGNASDGRKVKGTLHWVSATHGIAAEIRLYEHLFSVENPDDVADDEDFTVNLNPDSLSVKMGILEPALAEVKPGSKFQFMRNGYYAADLVDWSADRPVFNRTVSLRGSYNKGK